jgi:hypothetical protein
MVRKSRARAYQAVFQCGVNFEKVFSLIFAFVDAKVEVNADTLVVNLRDSVELDFE